MYPQKSSMILVVFDAITYMIPVCYICRVEENASLASRRASSACKKGMFSNVEGPLLALSSALSRMERRVVNEIYLQLRYAC